MKISVVIPTLDEAEGIVETLRSATGAGSGTPASTGVAGRETEVIVVDGGSRDETVRLARESGARVLESERGRARQLRMGGEKSTGEAIVFLHADTRLPPGWAQEVREALSQPDCAGGAFRFGFAERGVRERWIERGVALRVAVLGLPYGDQALFVRRAVLERMGGVPIVPIMEDLDLVRGIKQNGRLRILQGTARTSSRRYAERGGLRTVCQHMVALLGWFFDWDRGRLAAWMGR